MAKGQRLRAKSQEPKAKANCQLPFANCSLLQLASDSLGDGLERVRRAYILDQHGVEHEIRIAFAGDDAGHANFPFLNVAIPPRFIANATQSRDILLSWFQVANILDAGPPAVFVGRRKQRVGPHQGCSPPGTRTEEWHGSEWRWR